MKRTTSTNYDPDANGTGKAGWADAVPGVSAGTLISASDLNVLQEEIARAVESETVALSSSRKDQLRSAARIRAMLAAVGGMRLDLGTDVLGAATRKSFALRASTSTIVAVGAGGGGDYTTDFGVSWTACTVGSLDQKFVIYDSTLSLFISVGQDIERSADGITWTQSLAQSGSIVWWHVVRRGGLLYAFGRDGTNGLVRASADGITWATIAVSVTGSNFAAGAAADSGSLFVVMDNGGAGVFTSPDGSTWTTRSSAFTVTGALGCFWDSDAGLFVAVGVNKIFTSSDGITWAQIADVAASPLVGTTSFVRALGTPFGVLVWTSGGSTVLAVAGGGYGRGYSPVTPGASGGAGFLGLGSSGVVVGLDGTHTQWMVSGGITG